MKPYANAKFISYACNVSSLKYCFMKLYANNNGDLCIFQIALMKTSMQKDTYDSPLDFKLPTRKHCPGRNVLFDLKKPNLISREDWIT